MWPVLPYTRERNPSAGRSVPEDSSSHRISLAQELHGRRTLVGERSYGQFSFKYSWQEWRSFGNDSPPPHPHSVSPPLKDFFGRLRPRLTLKRQGADDFPSYYKIFRSCIDISTSSSLLLSLSLPLSLSRYLPIYSFIHLFLYSMFMSREQIFMQFFFLIQKMEWKSKIIKRWILLKKKK